jgi:HK97 family phage major capsid protein
VQTSTTAGIAAAKAPDVLLGDPVYTDPNVAALASNARVMAYGDFSAYFIHHVGGVIFERSDDYAFNQDLATFRANWWVDGDLMDQAAIKSMIQNV